MLLSRSSQSGGGNTVRAVIPAQSDGSLDIYVRVVLGPLILEAVGVEGGGRRWLPRKGELELSLKQAVQPGQEDR